MGTGQWLVTVTDLYFVAPVLHHTQATHPPEPQNVTVLLMRSVCVCGGGLFGKVIEPWGPAGDRGQEDRTYSS